MKVTERDCVKFEARGNGKRITGNSEQSARGSERQLCRLLRDGVP
jgi:hypothetical protein